MLRRAPSDPMPAPSTPAATGAGTVDSGGPPRSRPSRSVRRSRLAAVALALGALTMGVAETIHPRGGEDDPAGLLDAFAAAPTTWTVWALLLMATSLLQLPGVLAWRARLVSGRGAGFVGGSGLVLAGGLVALFAFGQSHGEGVALAGAPPIDPALAEAYTRSDSSLALGVGVVLALFGFHLGWALFPLALARAGVFPRWVAAIGVLGAVGPFFLSGVSSAGETVGFWLLAAVIGVVAAQLYRSAGRGSAAASDVRPVP